MEYPATPVILDTAQVRSILKIPTGSWSLRLAQGRIPPATGKVGASPYWLQTDVDHWLANRPSAAVSKREG